MKISEEEQYDCLSLPGQLNSYSIYSIEFGLLNEGIRRRFARYEDIVHRDVRSNKHPPDTPLHI